MPTPDCECLRVLATYSEDFSPIHVAALGTAGGFSGAKFWRVQTSWGTLCLRRWPRESPTVEELEFIHAVLRHVSQHGFGHVPVPYANRFQKTNFRFEGHLWELTPWLPGQPDFRKAPSTDRLRAALVALGEFHRAAATFPLSAACEGISTSLQQRRDQMYRWFSGELPALAAAIRPGLWPELDSPARRVLDLVPGLAGYVFEQLEDAVSRVVAFQPCIRDIWHEHVLFEGTRVTGLVDFGSMRVDTVAGDIARLLGSMALDDPELWQTGLEAYQSVRKLSEDELRLIAAFDRSAMLMSGLNWLDWIYRQHRSFEHDEAIPARLREIAGRLENLSQKGGIVTHESVGASGTYKLPWQGAVKLI